MFIINNYLMASFSLKLNQKPQISAEKKVILVILLSDTSLNLHVSAKYRNTTYCVINMLSDCPLQVETCSVSTVTDGLSPSFVWKLGDKSPVMSWERAGQTDQTSIMIEWVKFLNSRLETWTLAYQLWSEWEEHKKGLVLGKWLTTAHWPS